MRNDTEGNGAVLFWLFRGMDNTCVVFSKFHSDSSCLFMSANVSNSYLAEERHCVSHFRHAVINFVMK